MKIYDYIIPHNLLQNSFIHNLSFKYKIYGKLTNLQLESLEDALNIRLFFYIDKEYKVQEQHLKIYNKCIDLLQSNRFKKSSTHNRCVRLLISILDNNIRQDLVNKMFNNAYRKYRK